MLGIFLLLSLLFPRHESAVQLEYKFLRARIRGLNLVLHQLDIPITALLLYIPLLMTSLVIIAINYYYKYDTVMIMMVTK